MPTWAKSISFGSWAETKWVGPGVWIFLYVPMPSPTFPPPKKRKKRTRIETAQETLTKSPKPKSKKPSKKHALCPPANSGTTWRPSWRFLLSPPVAPRCFFGVLYDLRFFLHHLTLKIVPQKTTTKNDCREARFFVPFHTTDPNKKHWKSKRGPARNGQKNFWTKPPKNGF